MLSVPFDSATTPGGDLDTPKSPSAAGGNNEKGRDWDLAKYALSFSVGQQADDQQLIRLERLYSFSVRGHHFLLPEGQRAELISQVQYTPMPNAPEHYLGLVNVRGNVVPLYSLQPFISGDPPAAVGGLPYGLLIGDSTSGALLAIDAKPSSVDKRDLQQDATEATTLLRLKACIGGVYKHQGREWHMLDCDALFTFLSNPASR